MKAEHAEATISDRGRPVSVSPANVSANRSRPRLFCWFTKPRFHLIVVLIALVLTTAISRRARSSNSRWSLLVRVARHETLSLLHQVHRTKPRDRSAIVLSLADPSTAYRLPGEFEPQAGLLVSGDLAENYRIVYRQIVDAVPSEMQIVTLVQDEDQRDLLHEALRDRQRARDNVPFVFAEHDSKWVRDFAPMVLLPRLTAPPCLLDTDYLGGRDHLAGNRNLARRMGLTPMHSPLNVEGGNLLSNGEGLCLTSTSLLDANPALSQQEISQRLCQAYGLEQIVFLERLDGESTGHVDMFTTFTAPDTVVIGSYRRLLDPENAAILDRNAKRLANIQTPRGPLRVVRVPMPGNVDGKWRTYTNVLYANGVLLLPVYQSEWKAEQQAVDTFTKLLPGWTIARINVDQLIKGGGALHCVAMNLASVGDLRVQQPAF